MLNLEFALCLVCVVIVAVVGLVLGIIGILLTEDPRGILDLFKIIKKMLRE